MDRMDIPHKLFTVAVRVRPPSKKEIENEEQSCISTENQTVTITNQSKTKKFNADYVFDDTVRQEEIYCTCASPFVKRFVEGENGTILTYGETGAGKRFTMVGICQFSGGLQQKGVIPHAIEEIFQRIDPEHQKIFCSSYHLRNETISDLFSQNIKSRLDVKESPEKGVFIKDLMEVSANSATELFQNLQKAQKKQMIILTNMCSRGSEVHCFFKIRIETHGENNQDQVKSSQLLFIKLATSDRQKQIVGKNYSYLRKMEKSIKNFKQLVQIMSSKQKSHHLPFRDCKLSRLLTKSFRNNQKFLMFANICPTISHFEESYLTLKFAQRAMQASMTTEKEESERTTKKKERESLEIIHKEKEVKEQENMHYVRENVPCAFHENGLKTQKIPMFPKIDQKYIKKQTGMQRYLNRKQSILESDFGANKIEARKVHL